MNIWRQNYSRPRTFKKHFSLLSVLTNLCKNVLHNIVLSFSPHLDSVRVDTTMPPYPERSLDITTLCLFIIYPSCCSCLQWSLSAVMTTIQPLPIQTSQHLLPDTSPTCLVDQIAIVQLTYFIPLNYTLDSLIRLTAIDMNVTQLITGWLFHLIHKKQKVTFLKFDFCLLRF